MGLKEHYDPMDDYENLHEGETIYVLGSGATLDYLTPDFFDDKITIAVNFVGSVFGLKSYYCFSHYHEDSKHEAMQDECIGVFTPEREHGTDGSFGGFMPNITTFGTRTGRPGSTFDPHFQDYIAYSDTAAFSSEGYAPFLMGNVVDMIHLTKEFDFPSWSPIHAGKRAEIFPPIFNIADASISVGIILILLFQRRFFKEEEEEEVLIEESVTEVNTSS
jgi:hypothetical protein